MAAPAPAIRQWVAPEIKKRSVGDEVVVADRIDSGHPFAGAPDLRPAANLHSVVPGRAAGSHRGTLWCAVGGSGLWLRRPPRAFTQPHRTTLWDPGQEQFLYLLMVLQQHLLHQDS